MGTDAKRLSTSAADALVGGLFPTGPREHVVASAAEGAEVASEIIVGACDLVAFDVPDAT
jgi:hypothetical protein